MVKKREFKSGEIIGELSFIKELPEKVQPNGKSKRQCLVKCKCGNQVAIPLYSFWHKTTTGCRNCINKKIGNKNSTHKLSNHKLFSIWWDIKRRCYQKNSKKYANYGAKGVKLYFDWINDFKKFYDYITSLPNYDDNNIGIGKLTIDRIDNNGNYEPNNIRLVNATIQNLNKPLQKNNKTGLRGISKRNHGTYQVSIGYKGIRHYIGTYKTIEQALFNRNKFIKDNNIPFEFKKYNV